MVLEYYSIALQFYCFEVFQVIQIINIYHDLQKLNLSDLHVISYQSKYTQKRRPEVVIEISSKWSFRAFIFFYSVRQFFVDNTFYGKVMKVVGLKFGKILKNGLFWLQYSNQINILKSWIKNYKQYLC